ncbi:MAG: glycoside hydrolase family 65 protein [Deltaproteobacteria bacterium]|nr:glycoside hydrolase family 65 protein [Deltaproteobacteria bacterium]
MSDWIFRYDGFDPAKQGLREALCTLGNGYFATRGAAEGAEAGDVHYPGTYLAGCYNRLETTVGDRVVVNEDLVNLPNWLRLRFRLEDGPWFELSAVEVLAYHQELDLKNGLLTRRLRFRDPEGRTSFIRSRRLVHMRHPHLGVLRWTLLAEDWSGSVTIRSSLDGSVINAGVPRYRQLNSKHLETVEKGHTGEDGVYLVVQTSQSRIRLALAARTRLIRQDEYEEVASRTIEEPEAIAQEFVATVKKKQVVTLDKTVALYSSRDRAISECGQAARSAVTAAGPFVELLESHAGAWHSLWRRCDVELPSRPEEERILRLHAFHLLQTASPNSVDLDAAVAARGLHGEAYRGHIFWDELYFLPFYMVRTPEIARSLLLYRYHRLDAARRAAREEGYSGAMYPWQSGSDGTEETQKLHLNPNSGRWLDDNSHRQRHVNIAIVYNIWRYYKTTGDREFLSRYGAEMMLEIARFWASLAEWNEATGRYEIHGVMGPDEYHDMYPDADHGGLRNNAYTNVMVVWLLERAFEVLELLGESRGAELAEAIGLGPKEGQAWRDMTRKMTVPFHGDGIISQFEGYDALEEFDWAGYREKYGNIERLDRILEAEDDSTNRYKASKQADVLMLFYLLRDDELRTLFGRLGYELDDETIRKTVDYYTARTSHGSTLSRVVHAAVSARSDPQASWRYFTEALQSDVADIQGGTTPEGVHIGAMGGIDDVLLSRYAGIDTMGETLCIDPCMPEELPALRLAIVYQGRRVKLDLTHERARITLDEESTTPLEVLVRGTRHELPTGHSEIRL